MVFLATLIRMYTLQTSNMNYSTLVAYPSNGIFPYAKLGRVVGEWIKMRLDIFRLSLKRKGQKDAFERVTTQGKEFTREEWLRDIFSAQFSFSHKGNKIFFVPEKPDQTGLPDRIITGWLARDKVQNERTPPWEGLAPTEHDAWQASLFMIDPSHHEDGQKLAFEARTDVGGTAPILTSLAGYLNELGPQEPYSISVFPIIRERSFEKFVSEYPNKIKRISYDVAVPNMWTDPNDFTDELKKLRDKGNIGNVKATLESDGAINTDESQLDEIASHVEKGGGKITAKTIDGETYKSDDHAVSEDIETKDTEPESKSFWQRIGDAIDRIF